MLENNGFLCENNGFFCENNVFFVEKQCFFCGKTMFFKAMLFDMTSHMIYFNYKAYAFYQNNKKRRNATKPGFQRFNQELI